MWEVLVYKQVLPYFENGRVKALFEKQAVLSELGKDGFTYILLSVGELSERKNQETVIRALGKLQRPDIVYLIAGEGPLESRFRKLIREYGLDKQVFLLGHREDVASLYELADVFVHISVREGLGMAPLEAMAKGLPLVSSYVNGMKDYTLDGITGICIMRPTSIEETASAIAKIVSWPREWKEFGQVNREITRHFAEEVSSKRMEKIYTESLQNGFQKGPNEKG